MKFSKRKKMKKRKNKIIKKTSIEKMKTHDDRKNKKVKTNNQFFFNNNCINNNIKMTTNIIKDKNKKSLELNNNDNKQITKLKKLIKYNTEEMNDLSYNAALNYDKRSYCQFYIALLRVKHNLVYSFYNYDDYNSRIIKIDL